MINNYHTHTNLCDGIGNVEDYVVTALQLGLEEIGFSGHSYAPWDNTCLGMDSSAQQKYLEQIELCRQKYRDIKIYAGIELDYYSEIETKYFDYIIGSVHYVKKQGEYIPVDYSKQVLLDKVNSLYGGDVYAFIKDYYALVSDLFNKTKCNVIGHLDLITKLNKSQDIFDQSGAIYQKIALCCVKELQKKPCVFEINTGAIARGYLDTFYPQEFLLDEIAKSGKAFLLSSDCHKPCNLLFGLEQAKSVLDAKGYKTIKSIKEIL